MCNFALCKNRLNIIETMQLFSISEASKWASDYIGKNVTNSNIAYLVQYGLVRKIGENGTTQVLQSELKDYYQKYLTSRENYFKEQLIRKQLIIKL